MKSTRSKLINDSDTDAAVTLTVDGLNMFAFSENSDYRYVIVRKKSQGVIPGWHITNRRSDSFKVTEYAKSAVAQLLPNSSLVGTVTATFAAAWPRETMPPADERGSRRLVMRGKDATGRGPSVETGYQVAERVVGVCPVFCERALHQGGLTVASVFARGRSALGGGCNGARHFGGI